MWVEKKTVWPRFSLFDDEIAHLFAADGIEAAHRLVEDQELGIVHERRREAGALEHALRERAHRAIDRVGHADALDGSFSTRADRCLSRGRPRGARTASRTRAA